MRMRSILIPVPLLAILGLLGGCDEGGPGGGAAGLRPPAPPGQEAAAPATPPPGGGIAATPTSADLGPEVAALRAALDALTARVERLAALEPALAELRREVAALRAAGTGATAGDPSGPGDAGERFEAELAALRGRIAELAAKVEAGEEPDFRTR